MINPKIWQLKPNEVTLPGNRLLRLEVFDHSCNGREGNVAEEGPLSFLFAAFSTTEPAHWLRARGHSQNQTACLFCKGSGSLTPWIGDQRKFFASILRITFKSIPVVNQIIDKQNGLIHKRKTYLFNLLAAINFLILYPFFLLDFCQVINTA